MENAKEILTIVLSSSVLVGIITSIVTFVNNRKNNNLKYITEDRREWRKEIKKIVDDLSVFKFREKEAVLARVKVRINPYGKDAEDILNDGHIWCIIRKIENATTKKECKEDVEKLIFCLSLLLKYDWERTKKEVQGNLDRFGLFIVLLIGTIFLMYKHFIVFDYAYNEVFIIAILMLFSPMYFALENPIILIKENWKKKHKVKIYSILNKIKIIIVTFILSVSYIIYGVYILKIYNFNADSILSEQGYLDMTIVSIVMILIYFITLNISMNNVAKTYVKEVKRYLAEENTNHR